MAAKPTEFDGAFIFAAQSRTLNPHGFVKKQGFTELSEPFIHLKVKGCDMAMCEIKKPNVEAVLDQEERKSAKKGGKQLTKALHAASDLL